MAGKDPVKESVSINAIAIQTEYEMLPSTLYRYIKAKTAAVWEHRMAELDDEIEEENIRLEIREANENAHAQASGERAKKLTVDEVKAMVITSPRYRISKAKVIEAAKAKDEAIGLVEAIQSKKEMLISLGCDIRADKQSGISINEQSKRR
jgi:hypothetical protein